MVDRDSGHQRSVDSALTKVQHARGDLERSTSRMRRVVADARAAGATWAEVGATLGITGQGAQKRYGTKADRHQLHVVKESVALAKKAARRCPRCEQTFPSQRAFAAHLADASCNFPDGTTQTTLD